MVTVRPLKIGDVSGTDMTNARELANSDSLHMGAGIADETGDVLTRVGGVPSINGELLDDTLERNTNARVGAQSPRGGVAYDDLRSRAVEVLAQQEGLWTVGTRLAGAESNPELLSSAYRTSVTGSYTGGNVPSVDATVTGSGWTARVESITGGATGTFDLSLFTGTVAADTSLTHSGGTLTGVTITAGHVGRVTYYSTTGGSATSGYKCPKFGSTGGWLNALGVAQDSTNNYRFPLLPSYYNRGFRLPKGAFTDGAVLEIDLFGVIKNTIPSSDSPLLSIVLAVGHNIFDFTTMTGANLATNSEFRSTTIPTISAETQFSFNITCTSVRKRDRTQGQIMVGTLKMPASIWGGSGTYTTTFQRGTDKALAPSSYPAYDFADGEDATNKRDLKNGSIFIAVSPDEATSGEFYVNVHGFQVRLTKGTR